jgi:chorismate synthase
MADPTLAVRFAAAPEQKFILSPEQVIAFKKLWGEAPKESDSIKPTIAAALEEIVPGLGQQFLESASGRIALRTGPRLLGNSLGFSW